MHANGCFFALDLDFIDIADELVDGAPVRNDDLGHAVQVAVQDLDHLQRCEPLGHGGEAAQVRQQNRDTPAVHFLRVDQRGVNDTPNLRAQAVLVRWRGCCPALLSKQVKQLLGELGFVGFLHGDVGLKKMALQ